MPTSPPGRAARTRATGERPATQQHRRAPYVCFEPTAAEIVPSLLRLGRVSDRDRLVDLGSGDGRIAIAAARDFGAHALGVELNARLVALAREHARTEGVAGLASFVQQDLYAADLSGASVVTLFLLPEANLLLRPKLLGELRPGARILSHTHGMGDWRPEKTRHVRDRAGWYHRLHLWTVPECWRPAG